MPPNIQILETPEEIAHTENLQQKIWHGSDMEVVPAHLLITAVHNGGLALGIYDNDSLIAFVFGFPGLEPNSTRPKHCSHMLAVHRDYRGRGYGFALKRAQWQMVRNQHLGHITWTYDPLLSRNAHLNIAHLGAVCNTYKREEYGQMRDGLNAGLPSDRFQVDWWINTPRVEKRLGKENRNLLDLDHYSKAETQYLYAPVTNATSGLLSPPKTFSAPQASLALAEIPSDFQTLRKSDTSLARDWRFFSREVFESAFDAGYLVTDFIHDRSGATPRSFYVLAHGESVIG